MPASGRRLGAGAADVDRVTDVDQSTRVASLRPADRVTAGVQRATVDWLEPRPGQRVLDAGCGAGEFTAMRADLSGPVRRTSE